MLLDLAGIPSIIVVSEVEGHAWNYIYDGSGWYYLDATWNDTDGSGGVSYVSDHLKMSHHELLAEGYRFTPGWDHDFYHQLAEFYLANYFDDTMKTSMVEELAEDLFDLGLLSGTENGFELYRSPNRSEMAVMLTRMLGVEDLVDTAATFPSPFTDLTWEQKFVDYLYALNLVAGISSTEYGGKNIVSINDYTTMLLRSIGYQDIPTLEGSPMEFSWSTSPLFAVENGIFHEEIVSTIPQQLTRGQMVELTVSALLSTPKDSEEPFIITLMHMGVVDQTKAYAFVDKYKNSYYNPNYV